MVHKPYINPSNPSSGLGVAPFLAPDLPQGVPAIASGGMPWPGEAHPEALRAKMAKGLLELVAMIATAWRHGHEIFLLQMGI